MNNSKSFYRKADIIILTPVEGKALLYFQAALIISKLIIIQIFQYSRSSSLQYYKASKRLKLKLSGEVEYQVLLLLLLQPQAIRITEISMRVPSRVRLVQDYALDLE